MKNLSKLVNKICASDERLAMLNVFWRLSSFRRLLFSFVGRLSTVFRGLQLACFRHFIIRKIRSRLAGHKKNLFIPCDNDNYINTSNSHTKISLRRFYAPNHGVKRL